MKARKVADAEKKLKPIKLGDEEKAEAAEGRELFGLKIEAEQPAPLSTPVAKVPQPKAPAPTLSPEQEEVAQLSRSLANRLLDIHAGVTAGTITNHVPVLRLALRRIVRHLDWVDRHLLKKEKERA